MKKRDLDLMLDILGDEIKKSAISRRDALKMATLGSATFMMATSTSSAATKTQATTKGSIIIVGGGLAGIATAAKLSRELNNPQITIIEPNDISASYQPGQTLLAAGIYQKKDIIYNTKDFIPAGVKWVKEKAVEFDLETKKVKTEMGQEFSYDFMVIATGLVLDYGKIEGLEGIITSLGNSTPVKNKIGKNGINSIYFIDGAVETWEAMKEFIADAKSGKKVKALFTQPSDSIKYGCASKEIIYLTDARLREAEARDNAELTFYPSSGKMFDISEYNEAIVNQYKARSIRWNYRHNLIAVNSTKKIAIFEKHWSENGSWDPDLEEYIQLKKSEKVEVPFDFLHITPYMRVPDEIGKSAICSENGLVRINRETLQHLKYPDIFVLGDTAALPMAKTANSIRKQYKVVAENLISYINGKPLESKYDGYTVCPLITGLGSAMLTEFNWTKKSTPLFSLNPTQERWLWWLLKVYMLKPMTVYGVLSGRI